MSEKVDAINIVFCTDTNYIMPSGVFMKSVSVNNQGNDVEFHCIVDESVTKEDENQLISTIGDCKRHNISFYRVCGRDFENMPNLDVSEEYAKKNKVTATHTTKACYYRLSMANLLPSNLKRVLYFDCDIIVTQDLLPMWQANLEGNAVAAVVDEGELDMSYDQLEYSPEYGYFNSGAMVIDLDYWRKNDMFTKFLEIIRCHAGRMRQHDQEILNIAFHDSVKRLPIKYNLQENFLRDSRLISNFYAKYSSEIENGLKDYAVIHYTADKPWHKENNQPLKKEFYKYLGLTKWRGYKPYWKRPKFKRNIIVYRFLQNIGIFRKMYRSID
ncbi:MAG: glycosyltransferase family 8 protein [Clostridium sp.]|nr:glycosyltransferase family 8 protein [Clostridium sp.]